MNTVTGPPRSGIERLAAASLILRYLFGTLRAAGQSSAASISPRMRRSVDYIAAHPAEPLYVSDLARHVGLSESRFKARFRREVGLPPGESIMRAKIEVACTRLRHPNASITNVAHALGFSSSQYFATVFRRYTLKTPSAYKASAPTPRATHTSARR
ncbi:MAG: helix-turn-helix transcriptional regulator [Opitutaceae bacterium]|nr:helix-turn-helix transcriptional regulator [Opitutaceae bacterium]